MANGVETGKGQKTTFQNVAGLRNKDSNFWRQLEKWEVVVMSDT